MPFDFRTNSFAHISSFHLKPSDRELLTQLGKVAKSHPLASTSLMLLACKEAECWFLRICQDWSDEDVRYLREVGFSEEAVRIFSQLIEERIYYVCFDSDGHDLDEAPHFD